MKNKVVVFLLVALAAISGNAVAQDAKPLKIGFTNSTYLLTVMPESKQIESELRDHSTKLEQQLQARAKDFEARVQKYEQGAQNMSADNRAKEERELRDMQAKLQDMQRDAEANLQNKQVKLLEPVQKKIADAIDAVAAENNYTYIFNTDAGYGTTQILLHAPESDNVTELILRKMGINPDNLNAAAPANAAPAAATPAPAKNPALPTPAKKKNK
jgi:outer membrane protein